MLPLGTPASTGVATARLTATAPLGPEVEVEMAARADARWMGVALEEARMAGEAGEVPVGAVLVGADGESVLARAHNRTERDCDGTAHAEVLCVRRAGARGGDWRLEGSTLYVTLEPCVMCAGAILQSRVGRVVWGAPDPRAGACGSWVALLGEGAAPHPLAPGGASIAATGGVRERECADAMLQFFRSRRARQGVTAQTDVRNINRGKV